MSYSTKYYALVRDDNENVFTLNIKKRDYVGSSTQITEYEENPLCLQYRGGRQDFENGKTIFPSSVSFTFFSNSGDDYSDIFDSSYKDYLLEIVHTKNSVSTTFWKGWIDPANLTKRFLVDKYFITIEASDGLLDLKDIDFPVATASGHTKIINIVRAALDQTGIEVDITDQLNITESHISGSVMKNISANTNRFIDTENGMVRYLNCYDTLERLLKSFNCKLALVEGKWTITAKNERQSDLRTYNHDTLATSTVSNFNRVIDITGYYPYFDSDQASKIASIKKHNITFQNRNIADSVIFNGKFTEGITGWVNQSFHSLNVFNNELYAVTNQPSMPSIDATRSFDSIEFALSQITTGDTLTVSVDARIESISFSGTGVAYPTIQITLHYPDSSTESTPASLGTMRLTDGYKTYSHTFDVDQNGDYYVTISIVPAEPTQLYAEIRLDNILGIPTFSEDSEVTFDRYYEIADTDSNAVQVTETTTHFADSGHVSDLGAFKYSSTELTSSWNSHDGSVTDVSLMELLGYLKLQQRNRFIDYVRLSIVADKTINFNSIVKIKEKYYDIISFNHGLRFNQLDLELAEHLDTNLSTGYTFNQYILNTVDGKSSGGGSSGSVTVGQFQDFVSDTNDTLNEHAVEISALQAYNLQDITENGNSTNDGIVLKNTANTKEWAFSVDTNGHLIMSGGTNQNLHVSGDIVAFSSLTPAPASWWENAPLGTGLVYSGGTINVTGGTGNGGSTITANNGLTKSGNNIVLGGALTGNTTISGAYNLNISQGKLGIGVSPTYNIDISTSGNAVVRATTTGNQEVDYALKRTGTIPADWAMYLPIGSTDLRFYSGGDKVTFSADGKVGIGKTPSYRLDVSSEANVTTRLRINADTQTNQMIGDGNAFSTGLAADFGIRNDSGNILFAAGGSTVKMLLNTSGHVGIGIAPTATLDVARGTAAQGTAAFRGTTNNSHFNYFTDEHTFIRGGKATSEVYINDASSGNVRIAEGGGKVGIGGSPTYKLDVMNAGYAASRLLATAAGAVELILQRTNSTATSWSQYIPNGSTDLRFYNAADRFIFSAAGAFTASNEITAFSDRRLKDNIENYNKGLDSILAIQPVLYNMKGNAKQHIGVIAQDVQQIESLLVEKSNDILSVNYQKISVLLINAVKELKQQNDELRERIQVLEENNNTKKTRNKKS